MEKITRILAVAENSQSGSVVLEKAVAAARHFGAKVDLLVADVAHTQALAACCTALGYDGVTLSSVHQGQLPLHEIVLRKCFESRPDLVIKAPAGAHPLRRWTLDDNDWALAQGCPVPVLLVRDRPWTKPLRFAAAVDVSDADTADIARSILHTAGFLAMGFHGNLDVLYSEQELHDDALRMERAVKLAQLVREFHVGCEHLQVFSGEPARVLGPLVAARQYDVLVLGARSRHPLNSSITGGTVGRLIEANGGDVVLVKAPSREDRRTLRPMSSGAEQRAHEVEQFV